MLTYFLIVLYLTPWLLFWAGAESRLRKDHSRPARLQRYAMRALVLSTVMMIINFDPNFGLDYYGVKPWSYPLQLVDRFLFWAAPLLLGLGYFLERRPGPDFKPWPLIGKIVCIVFILGGFVLGWWASNNVRLAWMDLPWSIARFVVSLGFLPAAVGYFVFRWRQGRAHVPTETGASALTSGTGR